MSYHNYPFDNDRAFIDTDRQVDFMPTPHDAPNRSSKLRIDEPLDQDEMSAEMHSSLLAVHLMNMMGGNFDFQNQKMTREQQEAVKLYGHLDEDQREVELSKLNSLVP